MLTSTAFNKGRKVYNMKFFGIKDLYDYLKSNPKVNYKIFSTQASMKDDPKFSGAPLDQAIEYLLNGYNVGFKNFLEANKRLQSGIIEYQQDYRVKRSMFAGAPVAHLVAANVPACRVVMEPTHGLEIRNVYYNLSYSHKTTPEQIRNRGLATLYLIQALEAKGVIVNFRAFELSESDDENEIFHLSIDLKKSGETALNIQKCYYPMVAKEFLRRVLFRCMESSEVTEPDWGIGYGTSLDQEGCREFFNARKNDIVISRPKDLMITGDNIYKDTLNMIESLNLESEFNIKQLKKLSKR